jgi:two-component system nitrogen regulation response regulator GlnG
MDKVLLIDDEADVRYSFQRIFGSHQVKVLTASGGEEGLQLFPRVKPDLVIVDVRLGDMNGLEVLRRLRLVDTKVPVIMMTAYGTTQTAIEAMKLGAFDYLLKPFDVPKLKQIVGAALKAARDMREVVSYEPLLESEDYALGIVGRSEGMQAVFKTIGQLAASDATVLITGESGTGKELVARAIYHHSRRSDRPFLAINCAAIPESLLESELFGHEKGAFTGAATQRIGKFEQCHQGTLFLDEIGDMVPATQTKILRVLQSGTFERVGSNQPIKVDVRILAATNRPLEQAVASRQFREDLFYRLNVVRVHIPALRERKVDIPLLVNYFLHKYAQLLGTKPKSISAELIQHLQAHHWPGNVRELKNVIQRAIVTAPGDVILPALLPLDGPVPWTASVPAPAVVPPPGETSASPDDLSDLARRLFEWAGRQKDLRILPAVERELVMRALLETQGNQVRAARLLGITRATLRKRIEKFGIKQQIAIA